MADEDMEAARADETPEERELADETGATPEEAHRVGEFDDLLSRITSMESSIGSVIDTVNGLKELIGEHAALKVDNGAEVREHAAADELDEDIADEEIPDFEDFDLNI